MKVPAAVASALICFGLGAVAGASLMGLFGYHSPRTEYEAEEIPGAKPEGTGSLQRPAFGKAKAAKQAKGKQSAAKTELENLLAKVDLLTSRPLDLHLSKEQSKKLMAQIRELEKHPAPDEETAKKHLDTLLEILPDQKDTLVAAGFRWPGANRPSVDFQKHLKSLEERLAKEKTK